MRQSSLVYWEREREILPNTASRYNSSVHTLMMKYKSLGQVGTTNTSQHPVSFPWLHGKQREEYSKPTYPWLTLSPLKESSPSSQQTSIIEKDKRGDYAKLTPSFVLPLKTHSVKRSKHPSDVTSISVYKEGGESEIILGALMGCVKGHLAAFQLLLLRTNVGRAENKIMGICSKRHLCESSPPPFALYEHIL